MTVGDFINRRRTELGLTLEDIGKATGVSKSTVKKWETGFISNMRRDKIETLAKVLKVSPIVFINNDFDSFSTQDKLSKSANSTDLLPYNPTHRIPVLGYISAGLPLYADEHVEGYTYTELNHGGEYFALRVKGDSMTAARIFEGDLVIVKKQDIVENGEIAIVLVDDEEATVKNFNQKDNIVTLTPQSFNPSHKVQIYDLKNTRIRILGKVVRVQYDL